MKPHLRPLVFLSSLLSLCALVFYIVSTASSRWLLRQEIGLHEAQGLFSACLSSFDGRVDECRQVLDDCTAAFSLPIGFLPVGSSCAMLKTVRAFLIISIAFTALAFLAQYSQSFSKHYLPYRYPVTLCTLSAFVFGLIGWAVFISMANEMDPAYTYGYAFGLCTAAWILNLVSWIFSLCPWPYSKADLMAYEASVRGQTTGLWKWLLHPWALHKPSTPPPLRVPGTEKEWLAYKAPEAEAETGVVSSRPRTSALVKGEEKAEEAIAAAIGKEMGTATYSTEPRSETTTVPIRSEPTL